ncbi:hypothetical protein HanIR_Chr11g0518111 [Helianthus annuus]|nr:hypothetical protein HanIR_Chr11g0518111 [Helianthus annuus]
MIYKCISTTQKDGIWRFFSRKKKMLLCSSYSPFVNDSNSLEDSFCWKILTLKL